MVHRSQAISRMIFLATKNGSENWSKNLCNRYYCSRPIGWMIEVKYYIVEIQLGFDIGTWSNALNWSPPPVLWNASWSGIPSTAQWIGRNRMRPGSDTQVFRKRKIQLGYKSNTKRDDAAKWDANDGNYIFQWNYFFECRIISPLLIWWMKTKLMLTLNTEHWTL